MSNVEPADPVTPGGEPAAPLGDAVAPRVPTGPALGKGATPQDGYAPLCGNCGAELLGDHCYRCGQPVRGLVRHFSSVVGDFLDSVFNLDSRTLQTLGPLFFRPGFLTREYFAGRRVRYVTPVRMFVFLVLIAFFVSNLALDVENAVEADGDEDVIAVGVGERDDDDARKQRKRRAADFTRANTVEAATAARDAALAELATAREEAANVPGVGVGVGVGLEAAEDEVREIADARIEWLRARDAALKAGQPVPPEPKSRRNGVQFGNWDPHKTPVTIAWLPDFANEALSAWGRRAYDNGDRIRDNPRLLAEAFFSVAPQTLFVLLPLFAVLLKLFYVFKRRLYMEHMIVALHSHAFIAMWLILIICVYALGEALAAGTLKTILNFSIAALWIWLPLYLMLMQKRVYGQGWIMTLLKFFVLGIAYLVLLACGATVALALSLVLM